MIWDRNSELTTRREFHFSQLTLLGSTASRYSSCATMTLAISSSTGPPHRIILCSRTRAHVHTPHITFAKKLYRASRWNNWAHDPVLPYVLKELADDALEPLHHHGRGPALLPRGLHREVGRPRHHQVIPARHTHHHQHLRSLNEPRPAYRTDDAKLQNFLPRINFTFSFWNRANPLFIILTQRKYIVRV